MTWSLGGVVVCQIDPGRRKQFVPKLSNLFAKLGNHSAFQTSIIVLSLRLRPLQAIMPLLLGVIPASKPESW